MIVAKKRNIFTKRSIKRSLKNVARRRQDKIANVNAPKTQTNLSKKHQSHTNLSKN